MPIDHDQIFKQLIQAFFREFMELFCPHEATLMDFSRVEFLGEEHFTEIRTGDQQRIQIRSIPPLLAATGGGTRCSLAVIVPKHSINS